jgi:hypothetical protein
MASPVGIAVSPSFSHPPCIAISGRIAYAIAIAFGLAIGMGLGLGNGIPRTHGEVRDFSTVSPPMAKLQPAWRPGRPVHVLRVAESIDPYLVIFLGDLVGHREHWDRRVTVPCFGKHASCRYCGKLPLRFYGYAAVLWQDPRTAKLDPWVLQATASLEEQLREHDLRGQVWHLQRSETGERTAEVVGTFIEERDPTVLPAAFLVRPVLERMFQERGLFLEATNPNPDRVIPVIGDVEPIVLADVAADVPLKAMSEEMRRKEQIRLDELAKKNGWHPRRSENKSTPTG